MADHDAPKGAGPPRHAALQDLFLRRRDFLRLAAMTAAASGSPWAVGCSDRTDVSAPSARFLSREERQLLDALAAAIVPEDHTVGALGTGAVEYIDRLLAAFDNPIPTIYRSGPFSGRQPFPDPQTGDPSDDFPANAFLDFLPLSRIQEAAWRITLYGSASVDNGTINAPMVAPTPGARAVYREGIAALATAAGGVDAFLALPEAERLDVFTKTSREFQETVTQHLAEGMFCAPEYGGNQGLRGWTDYAYDGDSQPLGHTLFDCRTGELRDRPDQPNEAPDPNDPLTPLEPAVESFVDSIVRIQGGKRFF